MVLASSALLDGVFTHIDISPDSPHRRGPPLLTASFCLYQTLCPFHLRLFAEIANPAAGEGEQLQPCRL
jgi:hypothetical protein